VTPIHGQIGKQSLGLLGQIVVAAAMPKPAEQLDFKHFCRAVHPITSPKARFFTLRSRSSARCIHADSLLEFRLLSIDTGQRQLMTAGRRAAP
jgi:hypothetical protein